VNWEDTPVERSSPSFGGDIMKKLAVIIAALTIGAGAGVAFAQSSAAPTSAVTNAEKWTTKQ
jgi:hypothetical protein